ncbi:hypothetical protein EU546_08315 [Candidatus Thorarchaeota archaeon]|nr:MAG: hypothetical protein EU546_08315 [Candidatus Thorarchaeota archaeon]
MGKSMRLYVTGKVEGMTKKEIKKLVESKGHTYGSFTKKTKLLVYADRAGPSKLEKARSWGIEIMSWSEFVKTLD